MWLSRLGQDYDVGTVLGASDSDGQADASGSACDNNGFALEASSSLRLGDLVEEDVGDASLLLLRLHDGGLGCLRIRM